MFDIGLAELLIIVVAAVVVVGPKELPAALRQAGRWLGKMRRMSNHVRSGIDTMIREAEMEDMEKEWKAQNERIMRDHPDAAEDLAEFEPMREHKGASAEGPQMRPLAPPPETPPSNPPAPEETARPERGPDDPPLPSELPQLPFGEGKG